MVNAKGREETKHVRHPVFRKTSFSSFLWAPSHTVRNVETTPDTGCFAKGGQKNTVAGNITGALDFGLGKREISVQSADA